jgi:hypothetical protein
VATILNELQLDALTEMVNIGVNRAAAGLREMVGEQVHLSVPKVSLVSRESAIATLGESEAANLVGIHQVFEGDVTGRALLIFPDTKSLELVRARHGRRAAARGDHRARARGAGRDRQHHPERLAWRPWPTCSSAISRCRCPRSSAASRPFSSISRRRPRRARS